MKTLLNIAIFIFLINSGNLLYAQKQQQQISFEFYNHTFNLSIDSALQLPASAELSKQQILKYYEQVNAAPFKLIVDSLIAYKVNHQLNDWLYYQLIRKTAEQISPKKANYERYTFFKWFLMVKSGYDSRLAIADGRIILYVYNDEDISDIPYVRYENKRYICMNIHDYAYADLNKVPAQGMIGSPDAKQSFSYRITRMPDFSPGDYKDKQLAFKYKQKTFHFNIKLNEEVADLFNNYPVVDFESYFNIPLSKETYRSLIPVLRKNICGMKQKKGIDYLMRFTRYAFLYEDDEANYGKEKRLSPEVTLFAEYSDCDDRAALFFYLVKEIYDLSMIALLYPTHITIAVQFDKPVGLPIVYKGNIYSVCEPTPQAENLAIGELPLRYRSLPYQVVYAYTP